MVKIRLSRLGRKKLPVWRVVAVDSRNKRDGAFIDNLGSYDPIGHKITQLHMDRINDWLSKGAQCTPSVDRLIKLYKRTAPAS